MVALSEDSSSAVSATAGGACVDVGGSGHGVSRSGGCFVG